MITLTQLNGKPVMVNCDLIESIERDDETVVTLTTGTIVVVTETMAQIERKVLDFKRKVYAIGRPRA